MSIHILDDKSILIIYNNSLLYPEIWKDNGTAFLCKDREEVKRLIEGKSILTPEYIESNCLPYIISKTALEWLEKEIKEFENIDILPRWLIEFIILQKLKE